MNQQRAENLYYYLRKQKSTVNQKLDLKVRNLIWNKGYKAII